ncbi:MAG: hypothetical protein SGJ17_11185 [Hyphomicrobiales bacterium]|nr:hypothetical protein [Hyphomicrobiales bacterium]
MISTEEAALQSGWTPGQIRNLKIAVIAMGVLLILGFFALLIGLYYQSTQLVTGAQPAASTSISTPGAAIQEEVVNIGQGGQVLSTHTVDDAVVVEIKRGDVRELLIFSLRSGKLRSRTVLKPE